jgi:hypothetical protein
MLIIYHGENAVFKSAGLLNYNLSTENLVLNNVEYVLNNKYSER